MKAVIALILALALLAVGIPLSHLLTQGEKQTITRTLDPEQRGQAQTKPPGRTQAVQHSPHEVSRPAQDAPRP